MSENEDTKPTLRRTKTLERAQDSRSGGVGCAAFLILMFCLLALFYVGMCSTFEGDPEYSRRRSWPTVSVPELAEEYERDAARVIRWREGQPAKLLVVVPMEPQEGGLTVRTEAVAESGRTVLIVLNFESEDQRARWDQTPAGESTHVSGHLRLDQSVGPLRGIDVDGCHVMGFLEHA